MTTSDYFREGYRAYLEGLGCKENPYDSEYVKESGYDSVEQWYAGWEQAERDINNVWSYNGVL